MLLIHQAGSVKIGEVVRYTLTYTPSQDRILPTPSHLNIRIKNTSALPLRAAWMHGPYCLHVSAYPVTFNPHHKVENVERDGAPDYESMLKAAGAWDAKLAVPPEIRESAADLGKRRHAPRIPQSDRDDGTGSVTWVIEIASQILFSNSASINYELLVGRDERSLELGFAAVAGQGHGGPAQIKDHYKTEKDRERARRSSNVQTAGVYSKAIRLVVEDTEQLWNKPALPTWEDKDTAEEKAVQQSNEKGSSAEKPRKRKNVHLVIVTHGLHSNLGADMLFLKESIDGTVKQARLDTQKRRKEERGQKQGNTESSSPDQAADGSKRTEDGATAPLSGGQEELNNNYEEDDDDEVTVVRGFSGNSARTENGIQWLGKRLAKYVLKLTYPDQPFLPIKKSFSKKLTDTFKGDTAQAKRDGVPVHEGSSIHQAEGADKEEMPYRFTSISFIGHSLGGLTQTYAIAYIQKHSPEFFKQIKPINFICLASPMLGLSNENPLYVKFALDFGLVGRSGQDMGLTWRPPTIAKTSWNAVIGGLGVGKEKDEQGKSPDPTAKPLLRILPTGPAHQVLRLFRNRTLYSNVVNDGIVPLRTSCLLFLDWRGLGKVEKARRENGLFGTMAEWGWAELTGQNSSTRAPNVISERRGQDEDKDEDDDANDSDEHVRHGEGDTVPQPAEDETTKDNQLATSRLNYDQADADEQPDDGKNSLPRTPIQKSKRSASVLSSASPQHSQPPQEKNEKSMLDNILDFFKPAPEPKPAKHVRRANKAVRRAQTLHHEDIDSDEDVAPDATDGTTDNPTIRPRLHHSHVSHRSAKKPRRPMASKGDSFIDDDEEVNAPPRTSIFESAGDVLHPPLPSRQWITDPSTRARTIFHDRVYHPEDIPPPPMKRRKSSFNRSFGSVSTLSADDVDSSGMKVEEKIARAYHRDLSWRKVLVRLEPDAHNNIIVRRMFANAYGWPVIKHLCDTHFADTYAARTRDEDEPAKERAPPLDARVPEFGEEVDGQTSRDAPLPSPSEMREARDELKALSVSQEGTHGSHSAQTPITLDRQNSGTWDDHVFDSSDDDADDSEFDERSFVQRMINPHPIKKPPPSRPAPIGLQPTSPQTPSFTEGHRGLSPTSSPIVPNLPQTPAAAMVTSAKQPAAPVFDSADIEAPIVTNEIVAEPSSVDPRTLSPGLQRTVSEQMLVRPKTGE